MAIMTDSQAKRSPFRRRLLLALSGGLILLVNWIAFFVATFDLNNYRREAQDYLSSLLSLPVSVGNLRYQLHDTRLALRIDGLQIGNNATHLELETPAILVDLKWRGLLERRFSFSKISFLAPRLRVSPDQASPEAAPESADSPPSPLIDRAKLSGISIGSLDLFEGVLLIDLPKQRGRLEISQFTGTLENLGIEREALFDLQGKLKLPGQELESALRILGSGILDLDAEASLSSMFNLNADIEALDTGALYDCVVGTLLPGTSVRGNGDMKLHMERQAAGSLSLQLLLNSPGIEIVPGPGGPAPFKIENLAAAGVLHATEGQHQVESLTLQVDGARLAGHVAWDAMQPPRAAEVTLINGTMPLGRLKAWLPPLPEAAQNIREKVGEQGTIDIEGATLTYTSPETEGGQDGWQVDHLQGTLREALWQPERGPTVLFNSLPFVLTGRQLQISNARAKLGSSDLSYDLTLFGDTAGEPRLAADFRTSQSLAELLKSWQVPQETVILSGQVPLTGHLEGPLSQLKLDLQADVSGVTLKHATAFTLRPQPGDILALHGSLSPGALTLDHGTLVWAGIEGRLAGSYSPGNPDSLRMNGQLDMKDLAAIAAAFPAAEPFKLSGQAELTLKQRGWPDGNLSEMTLNLRDVGLTATRHIANLNHINGKVRVTADGMQANNLRVQLGGSPLVVQARLKDFSNPLLTLDVTGQAIRADELVFSSDQAMLRDIAGHLEIDKHGLRFDPVNVRLDGGTRAKVLGEIAFGEPVEVRLDISSDFVRIGEVIGLWTDRAETAGDKDIETGSTEDQPPANIRINARAARGDLYGMQFQKASGVIVPSRERLTIHPLDFAVGDGHCSAKIQTDYTPQGPTLLSISGHVEEVDALEVYRELLNQKNIVRGRLRGDFSLQGETGANFLPSSTGDFSIEIHKGVLHKFPVLSKVFSLLNVSQLLTLQLPDMDKEGMPFTKLTANLKLDKGVLSSDDLVIRSEAMNQAYRGKLDLVKDEIDLAVAIQPLGTIDKIVSRIPVAGWLLAGENEAVLSAHFTVTGKTGDADVSVQPLDTLTETTIGLLRRTLGLPFKLVEDPQILWGGSEKK